MYHFHWEVCTKFKDRKLPKIEEFSFTLEICLDTPDKSFTLVYSTPVRRTPLEKTEYSRYDVGTKEMSTSLNLPYNWRSLQRICKNTFGLRGPWEGSSSQNVLWPGTSKRYERQPCHYDTSIGGKRDRRRIDSPEGKMDELSDTLSPYRESTLRRSSPFLQDLLRGRNTPRRWEGNEGERTTNVRRTKGILWWEPDGKRRPTKTPVGLVRGRRTYRGGSSTNFTRSTSREDPYHFPMSGQGFLKRIGVVDPS